MRNLIAIMGKDWKIQFSSPMAYVVLGGFLMLSGFFFYDLLSTYTMYAAQAQMMGNPQIMQQLNFNDMIMTPLIQNINVLLLLVVPLITMRTFAEENRQGTDELILTSPVGISQMVWGKFLSSLAFFMLLLFLTLQFPLLLGKFGSLDLGKMLTGYLGLFLMGAAFISLGMFASSLTKSQMVAAVGAFSALLIFWLVGFLSESIGGWPGKILEYVSLTYHFNMFAKGAIHLKDIVFFLSFTYFFIFLSTRAVESSRWR